ncbi:FAD-dependent thymidylate synthase [Corynebacterium sp. zg254]|uniref:Flavin-dependent thymidylate synthase n=1 Tax=Corynebacterium zhongnanshanii TaxID=2768834 RepID=A0ABQ6VJQ3_9CORY|nr:MULTISPECIES: FAD-dependent thymidylate synthase [Corynebacterium]KAB3523371.1 FAD-dependent thymidylate synthase [Corynebacterium zhongnanshanii]MCR5913506.1 FAD-dependent thymidylate synthase [Corynebacterium sp. zg254]
MATIAELSIDLVGHTTFAPPSDVRWSTDAADGSALSEFAGRACYETWDKPNPHTATNQAYVRHILDVGHTAVLEHSSASMYLRGVSRSCSHEIMRHRHFSFSQLSQRYVPAEEARVVVPEAVRADEQLTRLFLQSADVAHQAYEEILQGISAQGLNQGSHAAVRAKQARQAARAVLPNCTETRFVMTGNFRSWRHFIGTRAAEHADPEIRRIAVECLEKLKQISPEVFDDFSVVDLVDGGRMATSPYVNEF